MKTVVAGIVLLLALCAQATAQDFSSSHLAAAEELLEVAQAQAVMNASMDAMLEAQVAQQPALRQFEAVMRDFFARHFSWEVISENLAPIYAARFSEVELAEIIAFYRTPVGQKLAVLTPEITVESMRVAERLVAENSDELERMIMKAASSD